MKLSSDNGERLATNDAQNFFLDLGLNLVCSPWTRIVSRHFVTQHEPNLHSSRESDRFRENCASSVGSSSSESDASSAGCHGDQLQAVVTPSRLLILAGLL